MKHMTIVRLAAVAALVGTALLASPAAAQSVQPHVKAFGTGIFLGVNAGYQIATNELDLNATGTGSLFNVDSIGARGVIAGAQGGFDYRFANTPFLIRFLGSWQWGDADASVSLTGTQLAGMSIKPDWKVGAGLGYVLDDRALVYAGYQWAQGNLSVTVPALATKISRDLDGGNLFAGLEYAITKNVTVGLQYDWTRFDTENLLPASTAPLALNVDTDVHAVTARVNFRLDGILGQ
jgi:opacity protein-like surface antigen